MFDISHWRVLSNGAYKVGHTPRALDDDNRKIAGNGFYNVLQRPRATSNWQRLVKIAEIWCGILGQHTKYANYRHSKNRG